MLLLLLLLLLLILLLLLLLILILILILLQKKERGEIKTRKTKPILSVKGTGEPIRKASPLDDIRKIQETASNTPKIPERFLGGTANDKDREPSDDGRRAA